MIYEEKKSPPNVFYIHTNLYDSIWRQGNRHQRRQLRKVQQMQLPWVWIHLNCLGHPYNIIEGKNFLNVFFKEKYHKNKTGKVAMYESMKKSMTTGIRKWRKRHAKFNNANNTFNM